MAKEKQVSVLLLERLGSELIKNLRRAGVTEVKLPKDLFEAYNSGLHALLDAQPSASATIVAGPAEPTIERYGVQIKML